VFRLSFPKSMSRVFAAATMLAAFILNGKICQGMTTTASRQTVSAILITGATDGIGRTTARNVAKSFDRVLVHGRDDQRIQQTVKEIGEDKAVALPPADLSNIDQCRALATNVRAVCADRGLTLSTLLNNAGVYSEQHCLTNDGRTELTFAVNVLAPFVLTSLLLDLVQDRIVIASSISQCRSVRDWDDLHYQTKRRSYSAHDAYSESKLLDAMLTIEMADRLSQRSGPLSTTTTTTTTTPTCNCLDPGTVNTKMLLAGWGKIGIPVDAALDETWLCTSPEVANVTGKYFVHRSSSRASAVAYDAQERKKLWNILADLAPDAASVWN
jgi:NAD(P)-dependent dehydrogenase (short-subunit alcohol dehydrogenase family)